MGTRSLELFFRPKVIAVIGASERPGSVGGAIVRNLLNGEFPGTIIPINTRGYSQVYGVPALSRISQLKETPDLAIICTPAETVPKVLKQLHGKGVGAALLLTGGIARTRSWQYRPASDRLEQVIQQTRIRVLGPDCLGLVVPWRKFNASLLHVPVRAGNIAYVGQSGTLASGVMDWAFSRNVGFSHVMTLGSNQDVSFSDLIDFVVQEPHVKTILVQLDEIGSGKALVRSLRAASRHKLVLAVKSNRFQENPLNRISTPKGLSSRDALIDETLARAGVLRVNDTDEMFHCVDALRRQRESFGPRLAVVANGRGPAILALDRLLQDGGTLASLSDETRTHLRGLLPEYVKTDNPLLLNPELQPQQLAAVTNTLLADRQVDALLVIYIPGIGTDALANAQALVKVAKNYNKSVITSWIGEFSVESSRDYFDEQGLPTFNTPDNAITSYMYMVRHRLTQELLRETPESLEIPISNAYMDVDKEILDNHRPGDYLWPNYAWKLLKAYGFAFADNRYRTSLSELLAAAPEIPDPWVLRVHHRDYLYPFAYGRNPRERMRSVVRNIQSLDELMEGAEKLEGEIAERFPKSPVLGYTVQTMHRALDNLQFSFGIGRDVEIGPYLFFGGGGTTADTLVDRQVALPPLNANLAEKLIKRSHFYDVLQERSDNIERELVTLERWLVALSHIALNHPWLAALEVNAIRQRVGHYIAIGIAGEVGHPVKSAIMPYPKELESSYQGNSGVQYQIRPIRAEDEPLLESFYGDLSAESLRLRFFGARRQFDHSELARFTQIDYDREMAFVACVDGQLKGVVRVWIDPDDVAGEYSVIVGDQCRGEGLGKQLMQIMIDYLTNRGVLQMFGTVLPHNPGMLNLNRRLGFTLHHNHEEGVVEVTKNLNPLKYAWQRKRMYPA
ncbi:MULTISPECIES: bifunctional acetate--CoA ligase family protein/GNAT family N-acetyltransferase [unclassified Oceanobacter]|jgi:acetyltransferase|uniref:bifunctional acetate--CoA ligase family protein/GNAT family N-acetyltransferase n=3 Tax=Gammaproteobacteria TaxID=1236 RepID=UPI0026E302BC|nr:MULTISPECIES: bifunctional acetate--CoA ligase family protein/GNAT family N-acetyltransferase [unclassified Oceanobacter]MDO6681097.1 bifunctional acetate--CoA ligase family protein/GNAT family N-acetyltransferase [Oceanobacter sp. 5_MG-2023]MDP2504331.1 bifunctional acetate--CoA ligase family protein/GNAT family N-acetyltransferase [Oceanobacter sp. 3_MG-2023]MDP2546769.1 bifunctional acetate--CoA ligase family protein/GNAT family N-acetyltransferase [Oceanobacter sp. 4_MG-2023]MDP2608748.1